MLGKIPVPSSTCLRGSPDSSESHRISNCWRYFPICSILVHLSSLYSQLSWLRPNSCCCLHTVAGNFMSHHVSVADTAQHVTGITRWFTDPPITIFHGHIIYVSSISMLISPFLMVISSHIYVSSFSMAVSSDSPNPPRWHKHVRRPCASMASSQRATHTARGAPSRATGTRNLKGSCGKHWYMIKWSDEGCFHPNKHCKIGCDLKCSLVW